MDDRKRAADASAKNDHSSSSGHGTTPTTPAAGSGRLNHSLRDVAVIDKDMDELVEDLKDTRAKLNASSSMTRAQVLSEHLHCILFYLHITLVRLHDLMEERIQAQASASTRNSNGGRRLDTPALPRPQGRRGGSAMALLAAMDGKIVANYTYLQTIRATAANDTLLGYEQHAFLQLLEQRIITSQELQQEQQAAGTTSSATMANATTTAPSTVHQSSHDINALPSSFGVLLGRGDNHASNNGLFGGATTTNPSTSFDSTTTSSTHNAAFATTTRDTIPYASSSSSASMSQRSFSNTHGSSCSSFSFDARPEPTTSTTASLFGAPSSATASLFGAPPSATSGYYSNNNTREPFSFDAPPEPTTSNTASLFGAPPSATSGYYSNNNTREPFSFDAPPEPTTSTTASLFGASPSATSAGYNNHDNNNTREPFSFASLNMSALSPVPSSNYDGALFSTVTASGSGRMFGSSAPSPAASSINHGGLFGSTTSATASTNGRGSNSNNGHGSGFFSSGQVSTFTNDNNSTGLSSAPFAGHVAYSPAAVMPNSSQPTFGSGFGTPSTLPSGSAAADRSLENNQQHHWGTQFPQHGLVEAAELHPTTIQEFSGTMELQAITAMQEYEKLSFEEMRAAAKGLYDDASKFGHLTAVQSLEHNQQQHSGTQFPWPGLVEGVELRPTTKQDGTATIELQSITAMQEYEKLSFEEMRATAYGMYEVVGNAPLVSSAAPSFPPPHVAGAAPSPPANNGSNYSNASSVPIFGTPNYAAAPSPSPPPGNGSNYGNAAPTPIFGTSNYSAAPAPSPPTTGGNNYGNASLMPTSGTLNHAAAPSPSPSPPTNGGSNNGTGSSMWCRVPAPLPAAISGCNYGNVSSMSMFGASPPTNGGLFDYTRRAATPWPQANNGFNCGNPSSMSALFGGTTNDSPASDQDVATSPADHGTPRLSNKKRRDRK